MTQQTIKNHLIQDGHTGGKKSTWALKHSLSDLGYQSGGGSECTGDIDASGNRIWKVGDWRYGRLYSRGVLKTSCFLHILPRETSIYQTDHQ